MEAKLIEAFIMLFVVLDPFGVVPLFIMFTQNESQERKRAMALKAVIIAGVVLLVFAFVGDQLLRSLRISRSAFQIAGGMLLFITSIDMVIASHTGISSTTRDEEAEAIAKSDISIFPLAIPLIAGPGALTTIVLLMRDSLHEPLLQIGILCILCAVLAITYLCLRLAAPLSRFLGVTGSNVISRVFGILLSAMAIQFILDGLRGVGLIE